MIHSLLDAAEVSIALVVVCLVMLLNVLFAVICGNITKGKGHGFGIGFVLGFFIGFLGLIIAVALQDQSHKNAMLLQRHDRQRQDLKCGTCGANINRQMNVCPMCGTPIAWEAMQAPAKRIQRPQRRKRMR